MADNQITPFQLTDQFTMDNFNQRIDETNTALQNKADASSINVLSARMDTFTTLPSGSTSGDAELADIRVAANGNTYPNAGDAVRAQYSELKQDLDKLNEGGLVIKDEVIAEDINNWLDEHPEATTTVQDGAITEPKIHADFLPYIKNAYITPEMFGAVGDGSTDDSQAFYDAILYATNNASLILLSSKTYVFKTPLVFNDYVGRFRMCGTAKGGTYGARLKYTGDGYFITFNADCTHCVFENFYIVGNGNNNGIISNGLFSVSTFTNVGFANLLTNIHIYKKSGYLRFNKCNFSICKDNSICVILGYQETLSGTSRENNVEYVYFTECNFEGNFYQSKAIAIYFGQFIYLDKCDICNWNSDAIYMYAADESHFINDIIVKNLSSYRNAVHLHIVNDSTSGIFNYIEYDAHCYPKETIEPTDRYIVVESERTDCINTLAVNIYCSPLKNEYDIELNNIYSGVIRILRGNVGRILKNHCTYVKIELPCIREKFIVGLNTGTKTYEHILTSNSPYTSTPLVFTDFRGNTPYSYTVSNTYGGVLKVTYTFDKELPNFGIMVVHTEYA